MYILLSNGSMKFNKSCSILQGAKMILWRGPLLPQKYRIFQKRQQKLQEWFWMYMVAMEKNWICQKIGCFWYLTSEKMKNNDVVERHGTQRATTHGDYTM